MLEIIGKDDNIKKRVVCKNCSSILVYLPCDIISYDKRDYTGDLDTYYYINCPECNNRVYLKNN